jgi:hypothetical protein
VPALADDSGTGADPSLPLSLDPAEAGLLAITALRERGVESLVAAVPVFLLDLTGVTLGDALRLLLPGALTGEESAERTCLLNLCGTALDRRCPASMVHAELRCSEDTSVSLDPGLLPSLSP